MRQPLFSVRLNSGPFIWRAGSGPVAAGRGTPRGQVETRAIRSRERRVAKRPPMSNAEMEIARLLWELGSATAREVHSALPTARHIDFTTVQTYLSRLEAKGYLTSQRRGRTKVFRAKIAPARAVHDAVDDFVQRLFGGDSLPLLQHLIAERGISADELSELRQLVDAIDPEDPA